MFSEITKRDILQLTAVSVLMAILLLAAFFFLMKPELNKTEQLNTQLESEQKLFDMVQSKVKAKQEGDVETVITLQKKVPVDPFEEQLILDLEKAETISSSLITNMEFTKGALGSEISSSGADEAESTEGNGEEPTELPAGVKKVTVSMEVESKDYFEMERFLKTLEEEERILKIDMLSFESSPELLSIDQNTGKLTYALSVSAYYYPELEGILEHLPFYSPEPGYKKTPFPQTSAEPSE